MKTTCFSVLALLAGFGSPAAAQEKVEPAKKQVDWLCDWPQALAEARRTERPILLTFGAPRCEGVPGMW